MYTGICLPRCPGKEAVKWVCLRLCCMSVTLVVVAECSGNGKLASTCAIVGFIVMMSLDVGLA